MTTLITYFILNFITFLLVMFDKRQARRGKRRIRERTFFLWAICFGAAGIWLGMYIFRHKTQHWSFVLGIPAFLVLNVLCWYSVERFL